MLSGPAAISASGIVPSHVTAFMAVARAADSMILVRGVNPDSTALIEENYATKNLHVKGKSADWGPQAGFICEDQELGKGEGNVAEIQRLNGEIAKSFSHAFSLPVPLIVSEARLQDLRDKGMITLNSNPGSTAGVFKITAANAGDPRNQPRSQNFVFYATPYHYFLRENPLGMACYQKAVIFARQKIALALNRRFPAMARHTSDLAHGATCARMARQSWWRLTVMTC